MLQPERMAGLGCARTSVAKVGSGPILPECRVGVIWQEGRRPGHRRRKRIMHAEMECPSSNLEAAKPRIRRVARARLSS